MGHIITNQRPDFDSRSYGYAKLSDLITATTLFEIERRSPGDGKPASSTPARSAGAAPPTRPARASAEAAQPARSPLTRRQAPAGTGIAGTGIAGNPDRAATA